MEIVNTFSEGIISDLPIHSQPRNSYSEAMNGNLMDIGSGIFQFVGLSGNAVKFEIPDEYYPVAYFPFVDELIIWLGSDTLPGMIISVTFDTDYASSSSILFIDVDLNLKKETPLRVYGHTETSKIRNIYWTDRSDEPCALNIRSIGSLLIPVWSGSPNLSQNKFYTVYSGSVSTFHIIDHTIVSYTAGEHFVYDPTTYNYSGTATVRLYIPIEQLKWQPNTILASIKYGQRIAGNLLYGKYILAARYSNNNGFVGPINIIGTFCVTKKGVASNDFDEYHESQGDSHLKKSPYGIVVQITDYDTNFDFLEIIVFHANTSSDFDNGIVTNIVELQNPKTLITISLINYFGPGTITINDVLLNQIPVKAIGDITAIDKMMVITDFKERVELSLPQIVGIDVEQQVYHLLTDATGLPDLSVTAHRALYGGVKGGDTTKVYKNQFYEVKTTALVYDSITYNPGEIFKAIDNETVSETVFPVFARQSHYDWTNNKIIYEKIPLKEWLDYKDPINSNFANGFWGNTDVHLGLLCFDKKMIPFHVRYLGKFHTSDRNKDNTDNSGTTLDLLEESLDGTTNVYSLKALSLIINNLDLSDVIDQIGGFAICMVPDTNKIVSEGFLEAIKYFEDLPDYHERYPFLNNPGNTGPNHNFERRKNWYYYISPEYLFENSSNPEFLSEDYLEIVKYLEVATVGVYEAYGPNPYVKMPTHTKGQVTLLPDYNYAHFYQKSYLEVSPDNAVALGEKNTVINTFNIKVDNVTELHFDTTQPGYYFKNLARRIVNDGHEIYPVGGKGILLKLKREEDDVDLPIKHGFGAFDGTELNPGITIVQQKRTVPDIGTSKFDIEKLQFIPITPIKIITDDFKNEIYNGTSYKISSLQIFGGGCYVNLFDYARVMQDIYQRNLGTGNANDKFLSHSDAVILPLQSSFNIALRTGRHIGSVRSFDDKIFTPPNPYVSVNLNGISYNSDLSGENGMPGMWEEFLYDDSYHNMFNSLRFPALPANYIDQEEFIGRVRYSLTKIPGEKNDSFRKYLANNYIDLDTSYGKATNIDGTTGKLFFWQINAIGYIPVSERALVESPLGAPIQLGVGGKMERHDEIETYYGNQHTFGLIKTPESFIWFDFMRKSLMRLTFAGQLTNASESGAYANTMRNKHPFLINYDNPLIATGGIYGGYDPLSKLVFITFKTTTDGGPYYETIGINYKTMKYIGNYSFDPMMYITYQQRLFHARVWKDDNSFGSNVKLWLDGNYAKGYFYGQYHRYYIDVIIHSDNTDVKYDVIHAFTGTGFFNELTYFYKYDEQNSFKFDQSIEETLPDPRYTNCYVKYGDKYIMRLPITPEGRLRGSVIKIRFLYNTGEIQDPVALRKLITFARNYKL